MSDEFRQFVEKLARLLVPEDGVEEMQERREHAARESGRPVGEVTDEDVIVSADDEFLCSETQALWRLVREARELLKTSDENVMSEARSDSTERVRQINDAFRRTFVGIVTPGAGLAISLAAR